DAWNAAAPGPARAPPRSHWLAPPAQRPPPRGSSTSGSYGCAPSMRAPGRPDRDPARRARPAAFDRDVAPLFQAAKQVSGLLSAALAGRQAQQPRRFVQARAHGPALGAAPQLAQQLAQVAP